MKAEVSPTRAPRRAAVRQGALEDVRVVEFGGFAAGPAVGKHLADHGAEVIRVESRTRLDGFRTNYPPYKDNLPGVERAGMFAITNNNKLGVTLNLKTPDGIVLARRLAARADVMVENFTPGTMARLGLSPADLAAQNPRLITLSTCNQGQTGPHAQHPGFGSQLTSLGGFTDLTGWPDRSPALLWGPYIDYIAVGFGVVAVLAALERRRRTGRGCHVDLSQYESGLQFMAPALLDFFATGRVAGRVGNQDPVAVPHGVYPCQGEERWCAISVHDDPEWERLRAALGNPAWAAARELAVADGRRALAPELDAHLSEWTASLTREEVVARLRGAGVHVAPVNDMADLHRDPQLEQRQAWRPVTHPVLERYGALGPPFLLSHTPAVVDAGAPLLGEHNRYVFSDLLGLGDDEYAQLEGANVFD